MDGFVTIAEMHTAADILERASEMMDAFSPQDYPWSAADLRREALHLL